MHRLLNGYDRKSLVTLGLLLVTALGVGVWWRDLLRENAQDVTWFLVLTWAAMTALLCWGVEPARDLALAGVALACGFGFEWWGTHTALWSYFTGEKPPTWILLAWPVAALATARISWVLEGVYSGRRSHWAVLYWVLVVLFTGEMLRFTWPVIGKASSLLALACTVGVIATVREPKRDVCFFLAGSALGIALEYWGTTHNCWTYYTRQNPPLFAIAAHGFAQLCYARVLMLCKRTRQAECNSALRSRDA